MNQLTETNTQSVLKALFQGELNQWRGLPEGTTVRDVVELYGWVPNGRSGRLAGRWLTYHDFQAKDTWPDARIWSREGEVVRIDLENPNVADPADLIHRLGKPAEERLPPPGYRYDEEDELLEYLYPARGLVVHVSDPTLPGGSPTQRIVRVRAFVPMSIAAYDQKLGGQQPRRIRRPNR